MQYLIEHFRNLQGYAKKKICHEQNRGERGIDFQVRKCPQNENFMIYQEEPVAQRQEMVIGILALLSSLFMVAF